jgi:hypothetical protein
MFVVFSACKESNRKLVKHFQHGQPFPSNTQFWEFSAPPATVCGSGLIMQVTGDLVRWGDVNRELQQQRPSLSTTPLLA